MLGFATCAAFALLSPVLGLVMLPGDQALHHRFVTGTGVLAGFAGSALIGPLTGAALYGFYCWSQRSPLRTQRWNSSPKLLGQLSRFYTMFAILEMLVFSVVAYVVGLMLVKQQHPLPEGMDVGRAIVLFAVGYAALAPSLVFIFTVPVLLTRLWDWLHADEIQSEELFGSPAYQWLRELQPLSTRSIGSIRPRCPKNPCQRSANLIPRVWLLHAALRSWARRVFFRFGGSPPSSYMALPQYDPTDDLENGLLSVLEAAIVVPQPDNPTAASPEEAFSPPLASARDFVWDAVVDTTWYLVATGAFMSLVCSVFGYFLALCVFVGFFPPFGNLPFATGIPARAVGGVVGGGTVGLLRFVSLCARRARMSAEERRMQNRFVGSCAFGMVVGMALVPNLADAAQEHGFRLVHAVFLGLLGVTSAFLPNIVGCVRGPVRRLEGWSRLLGRGRRLSASVVRTGRDECVQEMMWTLYGCPLDRTYDVLLATMQDTLSCVSPAFDYGSRAVSIPMMFAVATMGAGSPVLRVCSVYYLVCCYAI
ncbi:hypothetical protein ACG7TL_006694 [Trametes sanguinea]